MNKRMKRAAMIAAMGVQMAPVVLVPTMNAYTAYADTTSVVAGDALNIGELQDSKAGLTQVITSGGKKLYDKVTVDPGDKVDFSIVMTPGNRALMTEFTDVLPEGLTFAKGKDSVKVYSVNNDGSIGENISSEGEFVYSGRTVTWLPTTPANYMFAGARGTRNRLLFKVSAIVKKDAEHPESFTNTASARWTNPKIPNDPGTTLEDTATVAVREKPEAIKETSKDDLNYSKAAVKSEAVDLERKTNTWDWKVSVKLSNNIDYQSVTLTDVLEDVQQVNLKTVHIYDWNGQDVTDQGTLTETEAEGGQRKLVWVASGSFVKQMNKEFGSGNQEKTPRMTIKFKATAADTANELLIPYLDEESNRAVIPNTAILETTDRRGNISTTSNTSHIKFFLENNVSNPQKKVTDLNERDVNRNNLGLVDRNQKYTISFDTSNGSGFSKLNILDMMPKGFTADGGKVKITNAAGKDVSGLFNVGIDGQTFSAAIKKEAIESKDLVNTTIKFEIPGKATRWLGDTIKNEASIEDFDKELKTNETLTVIPADGSAKKEASINNLDFAKAETDEDAVKVDRYDATYFWKNSFELPNLTQYKSVVITDVFENVQAINPESVTITDANGVNVTGRGDITINDLNNTQKEVKWVAHGDFLAEINAAYGESNPAKPVLTLGIATTVKDTELTLMEGYKNANEEFIIPNTASISLLDNSGITTDYKIDTNISKVNIPAKVVPNSPDKTVTDSNQHRVTDNNVGLESLVQTYNITLRTSAGWKLSNLNITDDMPDDFNTSVDQVSIRNGDGKDVKALFDVAIGEGNTLTAILKDEAKTNRDVIDTEIDVAVSGVYPKGYGQLVNNQAKVTGPIAAYDTNSVVSAIPSTPTSTKSVSVNEGASFHEQADLVNRSDEYIWKLDFTLANLTDYSEIKLTDEFESLQATDVKRVHIYDANGTDVTSKGEVAITEKGGKSYITWTANKDYIGEVNNSYGSKSVEKPVLTMKVTTDLINASNKDEAKFYNEEFNKVIIPNSGKQDLKAAKNEGKVTVNTNVAKVTLPAPGQGVVAKFIAPDKVDAQWSDKLQLETFDDIYKYRTEFKLPKNFNFDKGDMVLTDTFEGVQSYDLIKMTDGSGADISDKFDIRVEKNVKDTSQLIVTAVPKRANDFDDRGDTINMVISGVKLTGANGPDMAAYITGRGDSSGFESGVTIPNISSFVFNTAIPNQAQNGESNKTYVNFDMEASLSKWAENEEVKVVNPAEATNETTLPDLIAAAQDIISSPGNVSNDKLKKLSKALTDKSTTRTSLLNLLIDAASSRR